MKYRLLDLLACPICKKFPLEHVVIEEKVYERSFQVEDKPFCELYCGLRRAMVGEVKETPCEECFKREVVTGVLYCPNCGRWYPIDEEIPRMLPDELREEKYEKAFLQKYKDRIPEKIVLHGKPFNLS